MMCDTIFNDAGVLGDDTYYVFLFVFRVGLKGGVKYTSRLSSLVADWGQFLI